MIYIFFVFYFYYYYIENISRLQEHILQLQLTINNIFSHNNLYEFS